MNTRYEQLLFFLSGFYSHKLESPARLCAKGLKEAKGFSIVHFTGQWHEVAAAHITLLEMTDLTHQKSDNVL